MSPVWSADGRTIYYSSIDPSGRKTTIMRRPADGSRDAEPVVVLESRAYLQAVTPDEKTALLDYQVRRTGGGKGEIVTLALAADAKPEPLVTLSLRRVRAHLVPGSALACLSVRRERTRRGVRARDVERRRPLASLNQRR